MFSDELRAIDTPGGADVDHRNVKVVQDLQLLFKVDGDFVAKRADFHHLVVIAFQLNRNISGIVAVPVGDTQGRVDIARLSPLQISRRLGGIKKWRLAR